MSANVRNVFQYFRRRYDALRFGSVDPSAPLGRRGEQAAAQLLRRKKLVIIAHSESDRAGEIDLIAVDQRQRLIVFVEVKTLATTKPGHPADRVDLHKQRRVTRAALRYLKRKRLLGTATRFDVVAVWWPKNLDHPDRIEHYESAFEATDEFQLF
ncbi:MAG: YraN family protein [Planctomycetota bacterium]